MIKKNAKQRASIKDRKLKPLAQISLELPARVLLYLAAEVTKKSFWAEWKEHSGDVYHDEIMKSCQSWTLKAENMMNKSKGLPELQD